MHFYIFDLRTPVGSWGGDRHENHGKIYLRVIYLV